MLITLETAGQLRASLRPEGERRRESPDQWLLKKLLGELHLIAEHRQSVLEELDASAAARPQQGWRAIALPQEAVYSQSLLPAPETDIGIVATSPSFPSESLPENNGGNAVGMTLLQNVSVIQQHDDTVTVALPPGMLILSNFYHPRRSCISRRASAKTPTSNQCSAKSCRIPPRGCCPSTTFHDRRPPGHDDSPEGNCQPRSSTRGNPQTP